MTKDEIIALAKQKAGEHGLDPALVCAVIEQESAFDTMALRMEPGFERRYIKNLHLGPSESVLRATSFGLMQVMGEVARENGFKGDFDDLCCKPEVGVEQGCIHLANELKRAGGDTRKALLLWNGGANPAYPDQVLARKSHYDDPGQQGVRVKPGP